MVASNDKRKKQAKGVLNRPPETWCGIIKPSDGKPCRSGKVEGKDTCAQHEGYSRDKPLALEAFLPGQKYELPPDMPLRNMDDAMIMLAQCINWVHQGKLPVSIGNAMGKLIDIYSKLAIAKEKYSPDKIAMREITRAKALEYARNLTDEDCKRIIQERTSLGVVREIQIEDAKPKPQTEGGQELLANAEKNLAAMERLVEQQKEELQEICDVEAIIADPDADSDTTQEELENE